MQAFVENDYAAGIELLPATHNCKGMRKLAMNLLLVEVGDYCDLPCSNANIIYIIIIIMQIYLYIPFAQVSIWLKEHPVEQQTATRHGSAIHLAGFCDHLGDHFGCYEMSWLSQLGPRIGPGGSYG